MGFILLIFSILLISISSVSAWNYTMDKELTITPDDKDNHAIISGLIGNGNVNNLNIEEGEYNWLGQLNISKSMNITFKGNTHISNNNSSISTLFNIKGNGSTNINIKGYSSSNNPFGVKISGYLNPIYGKNIDSLTLTNIEINITNLDGINSNGIFIENFNDISIDYANFIYNLVDNSNTFNTAINLVNNNINGKRNKVNISNSFFENWDCAISIDSSMDDDSKIYDLLVQGNKIISSKIALDVGIRGNIELRENIISNNNIDDSYSNVATSGGNIKIDNLTITGFSLNLETYNGTISGNNINVRDSNLINVQSTNGINFNNINISDSCRFDYLWLFSENGIIIFENFNKINSSGRIHINNGNGSVYVRNLRIHNPDVYVCSDGIFIDSENGNILLENCSIIGIYDSNDDPEYNIYDPYMIYGRNSSVIIKNCNATNYFGFGIDIFIEFENEDQNPNYLSILVENSHLLNGVAGHNIEIDSVYGNITIKNSSIKNMISNGAHYYIETYPNLESNLIIKDLLVERVFCGICIHGYGEESSGSSGSILINNLKYLNSISPFTIEAHNFFVFLNNSLVYNVSEGVDFHIHFFDESSVPKYLKVNNFTIDTINETDVAWTLNMIGGIADLNKVFIKNIEGECNCFAIGLMLCLSNSTAHINNSWFNNITGYGIYLEEIDNEDFNNGHRLFVSRSNFTNIGYSENFCCPLEGAGILTHNGLVVEDNCNFIRNKNGIVIDCACGEGMNNIIKGSNFLNNTNFGVVIGYGGANNFINFNRFVDNSKAAIYLGESSHNNNLNSNWFGINDITGHVIGFNSTENPSTNAQYILDNWFITILSADKDKVLSNETNTIRYNMGLTTDGFNIYDLTQTTNLPDFLTTINFYNNGSLYYNETFGANTAEYSIDMKFAAGNYTVNSITDYQINNLTLESVQTITPVNPDPIGPVDPNPIYSDPVDPVNPSSKYPDNGNRSTVTNAAMKETGVPIITMLLVLLSSLGLVIRKR